MNRTTFRTLVVSLVILMTFTPPARAILGLGDIVFDPTNFEEAVRQLVQMEQQYAQLVQSYLVLKSQYDHMRRMAQIVPVNMFARYRALATPWRLSTATNTYGTTGGWIGGINSGIGIGPGYANATERLGQYGSAFNNIPADQQDRVKTSYATVELTDGANQHAMDTVGRLRGNAGEVERAIQGLEDDSLSSDPSMNTEIAVLNKINAANLIGVRNSQDANKLLVALAESQAIEAKRTRDAEARAINNHIRFMSESKAVMTAQASGASEAMLAWRMP
jgi:lipopolysaccharide biosynthesis regulator YciM